MGKTKQKKQDTAQKDTKAEKRDPITYIEVILSSKYADAHNIGTLFIGSIPVRSDAYKKVRVYPFVEKLLEDGIIVKREGK